MEDLEDRPVWQEAKQEQTETRDTDYVQIQLVGPVTPTD